MIGIISSIQRHALAVAFCADILNKATSTAPKPFAQWRASAKPDWDLTEEGLYATGMRFSSAEEHEKVFSYFQKAVAKNRGSHKVAYQLARTERKLKRYKDAIEHYQLALKLKPDFAEAYGGIGLTYKDLRVASIDDVIANAACRSSGCAWHTAIYRGPCSHQAREK